MEEARKIIEETIKSQESKLREINQSIHDHPELAYEEVFAHDTITSYLEKEGFNVKRHTYGLDTSFEAELNIGQDKGSKNGRTVIFCAEYDALPNIGHACGHNLISTSSIAGFLGVAKAITNTKTPPSRLILLGTPAEEGKGGKVKLIESGAFSDPKISLALMTHPMGSSQIRGNSSGVAGKKLIASYKFKVEYFGKTAHAAAEPWNGINALDAAITAYNNVSVLRQQLPPDERIHGIIEDGGTVPNIIPEYTRMNWYIRSPTMKRCELLVTKVKKCFEAASLSTGCELNYISSPTYMNLRANKSLCQYFVEEMKILGDDKMEIMDEIPTTASTDMGNVSHKVPSFHGSFVIPTPKGVAMHNPAFAEAAGTEEAFQNAIKSAKGMAMLAYRVLVDDEVAQAARKDFELDDE